MTHDFGPIPARGKLPGMRALTSGAADADGMPEPVRSAARAAEPRRPSGFGTVVPVLGGLAAAAAVTIAAFFGIGLVLLLGRPMGWVRSAAPTAETQPVSAVSPAAVAGWTGALAPPDVAAGPSDAQPPTGRVSSTSRASVPPPKPAAPPVAPPPSGTALADRVAPSPDQDAARTSQNAAAAPSGARAKPPVANQPAAKPEAGAPRASTEPAMTATLSVAEITTLLAQGDDAFREGDLTSARLYYLRAFGAGDGRGALGLGASYDPEFLRRFHLWTQHADPAEARRWYLRARQLGAPGADVRLYKLGAKAPQ
jgi:hypothetical protein